MGRRRRTSCWGSTTWADTRLFSAAIAVAVVTTFAVSAVGVAAAGGVAACATAPCAVAAFTAAVERLFKKVFLPSSGQKPLLRLPCRPLRQSHRQGELRPRDGPGAARAEQRGERPSWREQGVRQVCGRFFFTFEREIRWFLLLEHGAREH